MPRIQFSDVVPPERRSIRDVPIPDSAKKKKSIAVIAPEPEEKPVPETDASSPNLEAVKKETSNPYEYYYPKNREGTEQTGNNWGGLKNKRRFVFAAVAGLLVIAFITSMMTVFASATISIIPKSQNIKVDMKITGSGKADENAVRYEVIKLSKRKTVSLPATGEEAVETKASGKIIIYNNFSSSPQRLIIRTRFETPDGLIYRIPESIIVPGKSTKNGTETPGSIEVEVFADEAGEKYNIKKTDFTIPGFKNDPVRYKNFYARSVTEMTSGFIGKRKTVLPNEKQAALQNVASEAEAELLKELQSKAPEGLSLLSGSVSYNSSELPQKEESSSVTIGKEVVALAIMLNNKDLSEKIVSQYISESTDWDGIRPEIKDFSSLNVTKKPDEIDAISKIDLQISGEVQVLAKIDTSTISQRLLGAPKKEVAKLMDEFAGISSIVATIRPVWKKSFPKDPLKIHVQMSSNK